MARKSVNQSKAPGTRHDTFDPSSFTAVRDEDIDAIAHIEADLVAFYQPANSEETAFRMCSF